MGILFNFAQKRKTATPTATNAGDGYQTYNGVYPLMTQTQERKPVRPREVPEVDSTNAIGSLAKILGPTAQEREAEDARLQAHQQKMQTWASLFDGLRHLGNLYYAARGATPQQFNDSSAIVAQGVQQERQRVAQRQATERQRALDEYNILHQQEQDQQAREKHQATLDYYKNRDEQAAERVAIQRFNAEMNAAFKRAQLDQKAEYQNRLLEIREKVDQGRISLLEAQEQLAKARAAHVGSSSGGGRSRTSSNGKKTTTYYDEQGRKVVETVPMNGGTQAPSQPSQRSQKTKKTQKGQPNKSVLSGFSIH